MRTEEDYCVECDNCLHCANEQKRIVYVCDECGADSGIYFDGSNDLCVGCLIRKHHDEFMDYLRDNFIFAEWAEDAFERRDGNG